MINFIKLRYYYLTFSLILLVVMGGLVIKNGLRPSIDFTGGSMWEIKVSEQLDASALEAKLGAIYQVQSVQLSGENQYIIRGAEIDEATKAKALASLVENGSVEQQRFEVVGPSLGLETLKKMMLALGLGMLIITIYVWWQFSELRFGLSAVAAMIHDLLIVFLTYQIIGYKFGLEIDVLFISALLTTLSFSVHDTIVVFDRIREKRVREKMDLIAAVNGALTETMVRSLNNSLTIILTLSALLLLGGASLRSFAGALLIGAITGTYSSSFVATPLVVVWDDIRNWRKRR